MGMGCPGENHIPFNFKRWLVDGCGIYLQHGAHTFTLIKMLYSICYFYFCVFDACMFFETLPVCMVEICYNFVIFKNIFLTH